MAEATIKPSAAELHVGLADYVPSIRDLVDRVIAMAGKPPTDMVDTMATESGAALTRLTVVESEGTDPDRFLRSWDIIGRASPAALTEAQYQRFLHGDHPETVDSTVNPFGLYGSDVLADH